MMRRLLTLLLLTITNVAIALPAGFVYLRDVDFSILQDMRYAGAHNFIGRPVKGYEAGKCILTKEAAEALSKVQKELQQSSLTLKVYDCYRPTMAVEDFMAWSKDPSKNEMKDEFYPTIDKADMFKLGYVAEKSGHSRGSTLDLTIVAVPSLPQAKYHRGMKLRSCTAPFLQRFRDNSIDMGTGYDCMDELSNPLNKNISIVAHAHRAMLHHLMTKYGFEPYDKEWWHFTLKNEPFPDTYFNFTVK